MGFRIIIPARYASARLPGKPLREIAGRPMIAHVVERARESDAEAVTVATDDERIAEVAAALGVDVCMTSPDHASGTERIAEVIERRAIPDEAVLVNLQGDEPLMPGVCLNQVGHALETDPEAVMATLSAPIEAAREIDDWHVIKVIVDAHGNAIYFSRAPIPWHRESFGEQSADGLNEALAGGHYLRHIGLYGYRAGFVKQYVAWGPCALEALESLEQLRVLYNGQRIKVVPAARIPGPGVNNADELARVAAILGR